MTDAAAFEPIISALNTRGWIITDRAVPAAWWQPLREQAEREWAAGHFEPGEVGHSGSGRDGHQPQVRGDSICWIEPGSALAAQPFFVWMSQLRQLLTRRFEMGLHNQEFHFACYPPGRGYQKHIDQHRGRNFRKISVVLYLNDAWDEHDGGEFCLYDPRQIEAEIHRASPLGGRLAVFVSWMMPHAVLPCRATRWSIAGWLRTDEPATPGAWPVVVQD